jgi:Flp pilus assembly protein TadB
MAKVGINVGEDFPAEEPAPRGPEDDICRDHEEWREKARAFRDDVRRAARKHFGDEHYSMHNGFLLRVLLGVALIALALAVVPHVVLLVLLIAGIVFFMAHRGHFHHHDHYDTPRNGA